MNKTIPNYNNGKYDFKLYSLLRSNINAPDNALSKHPHSKGVKASSFSIVGGKGRGFAKSKFASMSCSKTQNSTTSFSPSLITKCQNERIIAQNLRLLRLFEECGVDVV